MIKKKVIKCYIYYEFASVWSQADADNAENVMPRMGYVIMYTGFPVSWCSKLHTKINLSTTEAEYTALRQVMRDIINFMVLMKEVSFIFWYSSYKSRSIL